MSFREEVRGWLEDNCPPSIRRPGGPGEGTGGGRRATYPNPEAKLWLDRMAEKGWTAPTWPKEYGGGGLDKEQAGVLAQEMRRINARPAHTGMGLSMIGPALLEFGNEEQKHEHLPKIVRGEIWWCQGYSEPGSGSDLASLQTRAVADGDDYVINGSKIWTTMAHRADWIMLLARTDTDAPKHRGISFILVDMKTPGVTVQPVHNMTGGHDFNQVFFDNVRVPKQNLVGEENRGWYVGVTLLDFERSGIDYSAISRRILSDVTEHVKNTKANGRTLASDTRVRNLLIDRYIESETARLLAYGVAWMQGEGMVPNKEASMSKVFGSETLQRVTGSCLEILGLYGQLRDGEAWAPIRGRVPEDWMHSFSHTVAAGTSEVQRNIIASRGLGLPRG